jgi:O-antigen/teichoic acid export membrane protein
MSGLLKKLFSNVAIYAIANILQRGMMLILLPIYARYFTKTEFGAMDLLYQGVLILIIVSSIGMPQGLPRAMYKEGVTDEDNERLLGVLSLFILPVTLAASSVIWFFSEEISQIAFSGQGEEIWVQLASAFFVSMVIQQYPLQILKAQQHSLQYTIWSISTFLIATAGNIYFLVFLEMGLVGMLIANSLGFGLIGIVLFVRCLKSMQFNFEMYRLKPLLEFGLPMLPALLGRKILEASDRYMLPHYHTMDRLGDYVMGAKVSNIVEVGILVPFLFAWQPFFYSVAKRDNAKSIFANVALYFFYVTLTVFLGMYIIQGEVLYFIGNGEYNASSLVVLILVTAALTNGMQYSISPGIHIASKLPQEASLMILAAFLNIGLNFLLIPPYAGEGAAIATLLSYFAYFISTLALAQRNYKVSYHYLRAFKLLIVAIFFMAMIYLAENMLYQFLLLAGFILTGPIWDLYKNDPQIFQSILNKIKSFPPGKQN